MAVRFIYANTGKSFLYTVAGLRIVSVTGMEASKTLKWDVLVGSEVTVSINWGDGSPAQTYGPHKYPKSLKPTFKNAYPSVNTDYNIVLKAVNNVSQAEVRSFFFSQSINPVNQ